MDKNEKLQEQIKVLSEMVEQFDRDRFAQDREFAESGLKLFEIQTSLREIKELIKLESEPNFVKLRPRAKIGGKYWFRDSLGVVQADNDSFRKTHHFRYNTGNYFLVKEDCEKYTERENEKALATQRIRDYILSHGLSFEPDYKNPKQEKYSVCFNWQIDKWTVTGPATTGQLIGENFDFSESIHAEQAARDCEDDLNILIGLTK